ncbi:MAG: AraC family transcriptional regulator [Polyangiaceae bacterium]|nr:AraC family transcriptional regulator [Polyangiaceae bacterium]
MDTLSEVLRAVRLTGAVFFSIDASAPWAADAPEGQAVVPHIMPGAEHVIEYHVVTRGSCWGGLLDQPPVLLEAGDVIVFPQGDAHVLSSEPGMREAPDFDLFRNLRTSRLPVEVSLGGGSEERTQIICGFFGCDARPFNPLLAALPRVLHLPAEKVRNPVLHQLVHLAMRESSLPEAGTDCVLARVSELLFVEVVRSHVGALPIETTGWLAGLRDNRIGKALQCLHARPAHAWTLDELAKEVGVSRSVLAERFAHFVGIPPIQYLAKWRLQLAASLLRTTQQSLAEVAAEVGYGSETALSHAFKRDVGVSPAHYRRRSARE